MVVILNDDRVTDVEAYLPIARAFAADAVKHDEGCISMEVLVDPRTPGRVLYLSHFESEEAFRKHAGGETFRKWLPELEVQIMSVIFKNPICARSVRIDDLDSWYDCSLHRLRDYSKVKHIRQTVSSGSQSFVVE